MHPNIAPKKTVAQTSKSLKFIESFFLFEVSNQCRLQGIFLMMQPIVAYKQKKRRLFFLFNGVFFPTNRAKPLASFWFGSVASSVPWQSALAGILP